MALSGRPRLNLSMPKFSPDRPTVPGWYFIRYRLDKHAGIPPESVGPDTVAVVTESVYVYERTGTFCFDSRLPELGTCPVNSFHGEFSGPWGVRRAH